MTRLRYLLSILALSILTLLSGAAPLAAQEWAPLGPPGGRVATIADDPTTGDLYLGGHAMLYVMRQGERTWERRASPTTGMYGFNQLYANDGELLGIIGGSWLYHSPDGGVTWASVELPNIRATDLTPLVELRDTLYIYAGDWNELMRSVTNGRTWRIIDEDEWPEGIDRLVGWKSDGTEIEIAPAELGTPIDLLRQGDTIILLNDSLDLYRSYDAGATWRRYPVQGGDGIALHDDTLWVGRSDGIHTMPIDGEAWTLRGTLDHDATGVSFHFLHGRLLIGSEAGAHEWDPASESFRRLDEGRYNQLVRQILPVGGTLLVSTFEAIYATEDDGATWEPRSSPSNGPIGAMEWDDGRLYLIAHDTLYVSDDTARSWRPFPTTLDLPLRPKTVRLVDGRLHVGGEDGVVRLSDDGAEWERLPIPDPAAAKIMVGSGGILFATSGNRDALLYRSTDHGSTWDTVTTSVDFSRAAAMLFVDGVLFLGTNDSGLIRSTDLGETWSPSVEFHSKNEPLEATPVDIIRIGGVGDTIVVTLEYGSTNPPDERLFASVNGGGDWQEITLWHEPSLPMRFLRDLQLWKGRLLVGTAASSILSTQFTLGVDDARVRRGGTRIAYDPMSGVVRWSCDAPTSYAIDLHTITGEHVMTVERGEAEAGEHVVALPTESLPSGTYLVTVRAAEEWSVVRVEVVR